MRLALGEVVRPHWSERIHEEWMRNVEADYPDITWKELQRIRELMNKALPGASVTGHEDRIEDLSLPDPSDRHVLAAAIHVEADCIVTFNVRDFPAAELETWSIEATRPDEIVQALFDQVPDRIIEVASAHRQSLTRPSTTGSSWRRLSISPGTRMRARRSSMTGVKNSSQKMRWRRLGFRIRPSSLKALVPTERPSTAGSSRRSRY